MANVKRIMGKYEMLELRKEGLTLQAIANLNGISRQVVQQCTKDFRKPSFPNSRAIAQRLGISYRALCICAYNNNVPKLYGQYIWCEESINRISKMLDMRKCRVCRDRLDSNHRIFCSTECYKIFYNKFRYQNPENKEKHRLEMRNYQRRRKIMSQFRNKVTASIIGKMFENIKKSFSF